jgi:hypothetical protein
VALDFLTGATLSLSEIQLVDELFEAEAEWLTQFRDGGGRFRSNTSAGEPVASDLL